DLTLVENAPRTRRIWRLWLEALGARWPGAREALTRVDTMPIVFGVMENLTTLGVTDEALRREGLNFWLEKFFDDGLCRVDVALPGAVDTVAALRSEGVTVAYLTARPAWMREGTVETLARLGFPICTAGTMLVMKPDMDVQDAVYKGEALGWLGTLGVVILAADNEPGHCNAMRAVFPHARVLHVNTRHSSWAPPLIEGVDVVAALSDGVLVEEGGA
ncbi:MAG: hypothetical protein QF464_20750, partial [Myxococcota bacterium]|nr:hypothetical protein [Myxococcota bacterium]